MRPIKIFLVGSAKIETINTRSKERKQAKKQERNEIKKKCEPRTKESVKEKTRRIFIVSFFKFSFFYFFVCWNLQTITGWKSAEREKFFFCRDGSQKKETGNDRKKNTPPTREKLFEESASPYPDIFLEFDLGLLTQTFCATEIEWIRIIFE